MFIEKTLGRGPCFCPRERGQRRWLTGKVVRSRGPDLRSCAGRRSELNPTSPAAFRADLCAIGYHTKLSRDLQPCLFLGAVDGLAGGAGVD